LSILNDVEAEPQSEPQPAQDRSAAALSVYLAEATPDLSNQRDNIRRDLLHRGFNIVQVSSDDNRLEEDTLKDRIGRALKSCGFSIHLVGNEFGDCPANSASSIVEIQDAVAAERAANDPSFQRLIWIPDGVKPQHTSQRRFVNALLDSNFARNTELLRRSLENFKTVIQDKSQAQPKASEPGTISSSGARTVGIICDRLDSERVARLDDCLFEQGCDVIIALVDSTRTAFTEEYVNRLSVCDGLIIYMDTAPLFWVQSRLQDALSIEERRQKKFQALAVYLGGQNNKEKERFRTRNAVVIKNFEDSPEPLLGPI